MYINPKDLAVVLEKLIEAFPDSAPKRGTTVDEMNIVIGQQEVITYLMDHYTRLTS